MKRIGILLTALLTATVAVGKVYKVTSPNKKLVATVSDDKGLTLSLSCGQDVLMAPSPIGLTLSNQTVVGKKISKERKSNINQTISAPFYRQSKFSVKANQTELTLNDGFTLVVRAYDEGIAYRFTTTRRGETIIKNETAQYAFAKTDTAWLSYTTNREKPFAMAFQALYDETPLDKAQALPAFLPVSVQTQSGVKVTLLEAELKSYPGMFVQAGAADSAGTLSALFAPYPKRMDYYRWRGMSYVAETEDYIAKTTGARAYPWRIFAITEEDRQMPVNNLVYALSEPNRIGDTSWIRPGKVAWDWWNDWNLKGVPFKAGINNDTYRYYIDFAAKNNIAYVVLDEGWYDSSKGDIMNPIKDIDLQALINYGRSKGVDIVLWTVFNVLDEHLEEACKKYAGMGAKGFKVDFLDRDDQTATEMAYRIAEVAARHKLFLDYHGYYKPTGMNRTYPNILNYESVFGMEEVKWGNIKNDMPRYDVTFPFIRMMAGQVDFTPGAMRNGTRKNWSMSYDMPVSMGTRCHQLACYIVHDTPFTMLADAPTAYENEQPCVDFITTIPDFFDRTIVPQGKVGKYIVTAREKAGEWFVAGQTNWDARTVRLPLDFLQEGKSYTMTLFRDGINADHNAEDYTVERQVVTSASILYIQLASGGGFAMSIR